MQAFLLSDDGPTRSRARYALLHAGLECPADNVIALDLAAVHLAHAKPDLVVLVLPQDVEQGLAVLADVRGKTKARVFAVGQMNDAKLVLRVLRAGADEFIDASELEGELDAALDRWRKDASNHDQAGRIIAVLAPSGGSGSSTLAANVATVLAHEHATALLMDMKLRSGDLAALLDLKPTHTLADLCQNISRVDRVLFDRSLVRHASGVQLLAAPLSLADVEYVNDEGVRQTLTLARAAFPYVVVDLDNSFQAEQAAVLREADVILLVVRLDFAALRNAKRTIDYLQDLGIDSSRVRLVVNRHGQPKEVPAAQAEQALGVKIAHFVPDDARSVNRSNNNGVPVVLEVPKARVSRSIAKLAMSVNGQHKKP